MLEATHQMQQPEFSVTTPEGRLTAYAKLRGSLDGRSVAWWYRGIQYGVVDLAPKRLCGRVEGQREHVARVRQRAAARVDLDIQQTGGYADGLGCCIHRSNRRNRWRIAFGSDLSSSRQLYIIRRDNAFFTWDIRISKEFEFGNGQTIEPILEVFNLTNADNFLDASQSGLLFNFDGTIRSGLGDTRRAQLGVRFRF